MIKKLQEKNPHISFLNIYKIPLILIDVFLSTEPFKQIARALKVLF